MEGLWLLSKINTIFQITEKVAYGVLALYSARVAKRYIDDYKSSVADDDTIGGGK